MTSLLDGHVESFEHRADFHRKHAEYSARDPGFQRHVDRLASLDDKDPAEFVRQLRRATEQVEIRNELRSAVGDNTQYAILDLQQRIIAESPEQGLELGQLASEKAIAKLAKVYRGETIMFVDDVQDIIHPDFPPRAKTIDVFVATPIRNATQTIIGVMVLFNVDTALMENTVRGVVNGIINARHSCVRLRAAWQIPDRLSHPRIVTSFLLRIAWITMGRQQRFPGIATWRLKIQVWRSEHTASLRRPHGTSSPGSQRIPRGQPESETISSQCPKV
jgi:hypothetical protein